MGQFASLGGISQALFKAAAGLARPPQGRRAHGGDRRLRRLRRNLRLVARDGGDDGARWRCPNCAAHGYSGALATGTLAAGGTLGILIPPSIVLVIYAILTEQNIAKLFLAAFVPGILAAIGYMIVIGIVVRVSARLPARQVERMPMAERWRALRGIWPVLVIFMVVVGGIYGGLFTPTEGAAVGAAATGVHRLAQPAVWREPRLLRASVGHSEQPPR